jgi:2,5-diamino-6-(ribosylamino)-4(3H)-pyrimidinone 5'-phosphate reductase
MDSILRSLAAARATQAVSHPSRPFVLLTWAQSVDGCIAGAPGEKTVISCAESSQLTHALRAECDAILVGGNTALVDNPRLDTRLDCRPDAPSPTPVILDSRLRLSPDARMFERFRREKGLRPPVVYVAEEKLDTSARERHDIARIVAVPDGKKRGRCLRSVLADLHHVQGVSAVMVEGGASVLASFMEEDDERIVDFVIVTVAPQFLGARGVCVDARLRQPALVDPLWTLLGADVVLSGRLA